MAKSRLFCPMVRVHNHHQLQKKTKRLRFLSLFVTSFLDALDRTKVIIVEEC